MSKYPHVVMALCIVAAGCAAAPVPEAATPAASAAAETPAPAAQSPSTSQSDSMRQGEAALQAGNYQQAKQIFSSVLDKTPESPKANYYLAVALEHLDQKSEAETHYRAAIAKAPELSEAAINLAAMLIDGGKNREAIDVLRAALVKSPSDPMLHTNLAVALTAAGDKPGAVAEYRAALKSGDNAETRLALAELLAASGSGDEALVELRKLAASPDAKRELLATLARDFAKLKAYGDCVSASDKAIAAQPAAELLVHRGICRHELHDEAGAKADYDKALATDANFAPAYYYLGEHHLVAGHKAEAIKAFEKCAQLKPESAIGKRATDKLAQIKKGKH